MNEHRLVGGNPIETFVRLKTLGHSIAIDYESISSGRR